MPTAVKSAEAIGKHSITLITGDRVVVDAKGRVVGMERAKGRERIPVRIRKADGHTLVVPTDAARMTRAAGSTSGCSTSRSSARRPPARPRRTA